jgi:hypothetical protein
MNLKSYWSSAGLIDFVGKTANFESKESVTVKKTFQVEKVLLLPIERVVEGLCS